MTTAYQGDPFTPERQAWLEVFDGSYVHWHRQSHRVFVWTPGDEFVRVYHELEQAERFDKWLLNSDLPRTLNSALATITERVNAGYAHGL